MRHFIGFRKIEIHDKQKDITFPMFVMYPTEVSSKTVAMGPYMLDVSPDAPMVSRAFPFVIISHGSGGSNLAYYTLGSHLARNGFVVSMPEHPFNNRVDNRLEGTMEGFINRLRHITLIIDSMFSSDVFGQHLLQDRVAMIGHSIGANTALVLAGGKPLHPSEYRIKYGQIYNEKKEETGKVNLTTDARIKAIVLFTLDPRWFSGEGALKNIKASILLLNAEKDEYIPCFGEEKILSGFPENLLVHQRIVKNAGHFSFLSPFPEVIRARAGVAAKDPEGFDREAFHRNLNEEVVGFLKQVMEK